MLCLFLHRCGVFLELVEIVIIVFTAIVAAGLAQSYLSRGYAIATSPLEPMALLFTDGVLQHGTDSALRHFAVEPGLHAWQDIHDTLVPIFPDFPLVPGSGEEGRVVLEPQGHTAPHNIELRWRDALCWVTLTPVEEATAAPITPALEQEMNALRLSSDTMINPVWHLHPDGTVCWKNPAYTVLLELTRGLDANPETPLFPISPGDGPRRVALRLDPLDAPDWYEVTSIQMGSVTVCHANCINALVEAEQAQRDFVQSLAKTFAHLPVGLAIFDRRGQLVLFNPALVDLTHLTPKFLSSRPAMLSFFDQLREDRLMPEPKNYASWRQTITDLIAAASDTSYEETWNLEDGRTFSVEGRPHPDGATAFLFEDISAEVSMTRSFRSELELGQSLIDVVEDGLVVFSATGALTFCNVAYRGLWGHDPDTGFVETTIDDCINLWTRLCQPSALWPEIAKCISERSTGTPWDMTLYLKNGDALTCEVQGIASGSTLIRFRTQKPEHGLAAPALENLQK